MPNKNTPDNSFNDDDNPVLQNLSALVDGEVEGDIDSLLESAHYDIACKAAWQRYHLVRDVMQRDYHPALGSDFSAKLSQQISLEENQSAEPLGDSIVVSLAEKKSARAARTSVPVRQTRNSRRTWLPVAGLGLAASVAAAGFMAWQLTGQQNTNSSAPIEVAQLSGDQGVSSESSDNTAPTLLADAIVPTVYKQELGTRWLATTAEPRNQQVEQRLNSLLINHLEDSTMGRVQGMLAHSRVVAYDSVPVNESF